MNGATLWKSRSKILPLSPGKEVRLKYAYIIKCEEVIKDADGNITELRCTCDMDSKSGSGANANRKVKVPYTGLTLPMRLIRNAACMNRC